MTDLYRLPSFDPNKDTVIEDWYVGEYDCLYGLIYNHPKMDEFPDGSIIKTSRVVKLDKETSKVSTMNSNYVLGKPKDLK